jgi:hypothetical protein
MRQVRSRNLRGLMAEGARGFGVPRGMPRVGSAVGSR